MVQRIRTGIKYISFGSTIIRMIEITLERWILLCVGNRLEVDASCIISMYPEILCVHVHHERSGLVWASRLISVLGNSTIQLKGEEHHK